MFGYITKQPLDQGRSQDITFGVSPSHGEHGSTSLYRGLGAEPPVGVQGAESPVGVRGKVPLKLKAL